MESLIHNLGKKERKKKKETSKNARCAVLIIKREQQFGIFIYCNVILESFFISNGWFLNENVEEKNCNAFMLYAASPQNMRELLAVL